METDRATSLHPLLGALLTAVAVLGLVLVGLGVWALGGAIYVAWGLFSDPESIGFFAQYFLETTKVAAQLEIGGEGLAHYLAWIAVILLLLVLGKLGAWTVGAGAQLIAALGRRRQ